MPNKTRIEVNFVPGGSVRGTQPRYRRGQMLATAQDISVGIAARVFGMADAGRESFRRVWEQDRNQLERWFRYVPPERTTTPHFRSTRERAYIIKKMRAIEGRHNPHYRRTGALNDAWRVKVVDNRMSGYGTSEAVKNALPLAGNIDLSQITPGNPKQRALIGVQMENRARDPASVGEQRKYFAGYVYGLPVVHTGGRSARSGSRAVKQRPVVEASYSGTMTEGNKRGSQLPWHADQGWPYMPQIFTDFAKSFTDHWINVFRSEQGSSRFRRSVRLPDKTQRFIALY